MQQRLEQKDENIREKDEALRAKDEALRSMNVVCCQQEKRIHDLQQSQEVGQGWQMVRETIKLEWKEGTSSPVETWGEATAVDGKIGYFCDGVSNSEILRYDSETEEWSILKCPKKFFSVAVVNGLLTAIGGKQSGEDTKTLLSLTEPQTWIEEFPTMTYYHNNPTVVCTSASLIVAGGFGPDEKRVPVEVMDINNLC